MASSRADKAARRAEDTRKRVRGHLGDGEYPEAVYEAQNALLGELAKLRRQRPEAAGLIHAEVAAKLTALMESIPAKRPLEPAGWTRGDAVQPEHMLAVHDGVLARAGHGGGAS